MTSPEEVRSKDLFPEYGFTESEKLLYEALATGLDDKGTLVVPATAQSTLEGIGYGASQWERIVTDKIGSHETRSLAIIALGKQARVKSVIYANLRAIDCLEDQLPLTDFRDAQRVVQDPATQTEALQESLRIYPVPAPASER